MYVCACIVPQHFVDIARFTKEGGGVGGGQRNKFQFIQSKNYFVFSHAFQSYLLSSVKKWYVILHLVFGKYAVYSQDLNMYM